MPAYPKRLAPALALTAALAPLFAASTLDARRAGAATQSRANVNALPAGPPSKSTVRGRVVREATGRPVRRAPVSLVREGGQAAQYEGVTDADGRFEFRKVRRGRYLVAVDEPGVLSPFSFVTQEDWAAGEFVDPAELHKHFETVEVDGKADKEITVRARRGAVLTGRVAYADGDPAVDTPVHVLRRGEGGLLSKFLPPGHGRRPPLRTDDRGAYRASGLPEGEYVVAVTEAATHGDTKDSGPYASHVMSEASAAAFVGQQLLITFHPSARSASGAEAVRLGEGEERDGVNITIPRRGAHALTGVVRARGDKAPLGGVKVSIARNEDSPERERRLLPHAAVISFDVATTDEQGRWRLREIPEGSYTVFFTPPEEIEYRKPPRPGPAGAENMNASVITFEAPRFRKKYAPLRRDVQVTGDGPELLVELGEGARVAGTYTFEGAAPTGGEAGVYAIAASPPEDQVGSGVYNGSSYRGQFEIEGLTPGRFTLRAYAPGGEREGFYLKSITWNGKDLMQEFLEVAEGQTIEGVNVVFTSGAATLRVRAVAASDGGPAPGVKVWLLPADVSRWATDSRQDACITGDDGACPVTAPPGEYVVLLAPRGVPAAAYEAELMKQAVGAPRVSLLAHETESLELVVPHR